MWYQTWTQPIRISASFNIRQDTGVLDAGTEVVMTVYVATNPTPTQPATQLIGDINALPLQSPGQNTASFSYTTYILQFNNVAGFNTVANFEAQVGGYQDPNNGTLGTYNPYIGLAVKLEWVSTANNATFSIGYNPIIAGANGQLVQNANIGNAYWEFSPYYGQSGLTVFQNF
jgi:hypothetical protein